MKNNIRKFALVIVDDFDKEIDRFNLDYISTPKNLGFELEFTTLETRLTTYFTSAREKKLTTTLNILFLAPNAYAKLKSFRNFIQTNINKRMLIEYNDTNEIKYWEGKIQKVGIEELDEYKTLTCPISFMPATPKYIRKDNVITISPATTGKSYPYKYSYSYGKAVIENSIIENTYFDDVPLRVYLYGTMTNPQVSLQNTLTNEIYSTVRFQDLYIAEDEHLVIDAINSKVLIYRNGKYISAYDYVSKTENVDSFLYALGNMTSKIVVSLNTTETGYLKASYRQYTL